MKLREFGVYLILALVLASVLVWQAHCEEVAIAQVPVKTITVHKGQIAAYFLYEDSGCGEVYGFSEDRFEYEVAKLNPEIDINKLVPGEQIYVPWNE